MKRNKAITAFIVILVITLLTTFIIRHSGRRPDSHPSPETAQRPAVSERSHPPVAEPSPTEAEKSSGHAGTPKPVHDAAELSEAIAREAAEAGHQREAYDQPGEAAEFYRLKRVPEGEKYVPVERYLTAREQMRRMPRYSTAQHRLLPAENDNAAETAEEQNLLGAWTPLGPGNIGGRTRALLIDPTNPNVMYAAGVTGGVWKTTNGGASWTPLADLIANIAVSALAFDPRNSNVIYAGTGEGITGAFRGAGIFKSSNGGATWTQLGSTGTADFYFVNDLVISPTNNQRIYAATTTGVWRSTDGGASWTKALAVSVAGGCTDLVIRTDQTTDYIFAACGLQEQATIYRNTDAAGSGAWASVLTEPGMGRISLALAPSNQNIIYAAAASLNRGDYEDGLHAIFRSTSSGDADTWTAQVRNDNPTKLNTLLLTNPVLASLRDCGLGKQNVFISQGWYDNVIAVDPADPNRVWAGGVDLFRSDDGGANWGLASYWWAEKNVPQYAHADQHIIAFHPGYNGTTNRTMFVAGDGGVFRTDDARAAVATGSLAACSPAGSAFRWVSLNNGYAVTQFYHGLPFPDGTKYLGGTQDNGTIIGSDGAGANNWAEILGGDGGTVAIDPANPNTIYATVLGGGIYKSTDGGATFGLASGRLTFDFPLIPLVLDPSDAQRLWTAGRSLYRTDNGGAQWSVTGYGGQSVIVVAPGDSNRVVAGSIYGSIQHTSAALTADLKTIWEFARPREAFVSGLALDPVNPNIVYATYSNFGGTHVWKSVDGGVTWAGIDGTGTGRLPDIPVLCIAVDPNNTSRLYIGTDLGVFVSLNGGSSWAVENTGFANVSTEALALNTTGGVTTLYAFTHGRGAWRIPLGSGCRQLLSQTRLAVETAGGDYSVSVTSEPGGCAWTANVNESAAGWVTITSTGNGKAGFRVAANQALTPRIGTLAIAGRSFTITQAAATDTTPPTISITSPDPGATFLTTRNEIEISGVAADDRGVKQVSVTSDRGGLNYADGTATWKITLSSLQIGINNLTLTAVDEVGNQASATLRVVYSPAGFFGADYAGARRQGCCLVGPHNVFLSALDVAWKDGELWLITGDEFGFYESRIYKVTRAGELVTIASRVGLTHLAFDRNGMLYVSSKGENSIYRVTPAGEFTRVVGGAQTGYAGDGGPAAAALINKPGALTFDANNNLYFSDDENKRIRRISTDGTISTWRNEAVTEMASDRFGNLYLGNFYSVYKVTPDSTQTLIAGGRYVGPGGNTGDGGPATAAGIGLVKDITVDAGGNLYISDFIQSSVRQVAADGIIRRIGGADRPFGICTDETGSVYVAENGAGVVTRYSLIPASDPEKPQVQITGPNPAEVFVTPQNYALIRGTASDNLKITHVTWSNDRGFSGTTTGTTSWTVDFLWLRPGMNNITVTAWDIKGNSATATLKIRYQQPLIMSVVAGTRAEGMAEAGRNAFTAPLRQPQALATDAAGNLYFAERGNHVIRMITRDGLIRPVAGSGQLGSSGDGGPAVNASLNEPGGVAIDAAGNVYVADSGNHRIRKVSSDGIITTIAGTGRQGMSGDGGRATEAELDAPTALAVDGAGNLFCVDYGNNRVRRISAAGIISTLAGSSVPGFGGDGGPATAAQLDTPSGIAVDSAGSVYIADSRNHRVRKVSSAGVISTFAGNGMKGSYAGPSATESSLDTPSGVAVDAAGNVYIAQTTNVLVWRVTPDGRMKDHAYFAMLPQNPGDIADPFASVAADRAGNVYYANRFINQIHIVTPLREATTVSAASYDERGTARESIVAAFGANLATATAAATTVPLPTQLAGTTVLVRDSAGSQQPAPLFFVSPNQVNYQLPAGLAPGYATVTITSGDGSIATGFVNITSIVPALFAANADGAGLAAALLLRVRPDGSQVYEPVSQYDTTQQKYIARPISFGPETEQLFLVLFGTGIRGRSALSAVTAQIGGADGEVTYAGPQGGFVGLDQVNVRLPRSLAGRGEVEIVVTADGRTANPVRVTIR